MEEHREDKKELAKPEVKSGEKNEESKEEKLLKNQVPPQWHKESAQNSSIEHMEQVNTEPVSLMGKLSSNEIERRKEIITPPNLTPEDILVSTKLENGQTTSGEESQLCIICETTRREVSFYRCGHVCCCVNCGQKFLNKLCPICNQQIYDITKLFFA